MLSVKTDECVYEGRGPIQRFLWPRTIGRTLSSNTVVFPPVLKQFLFWQVICSSDPGPLGLSRMQALRLHPPRTAGSGVLQIQCLYNPRPCQRLPRPHRSRPHRQSRRRHRSRRRQRRSHRPRRPRPHGPLPRPARRPRRAERRARNPAPHQVLSQIPAGAKRWRRKFHRFLDYVDFAG